MICKSKIVIASNPFSGESSCDQCNFDKLIPAEFIYDVDQYSHCDNCPVIMSRQINVKTMHEFVGNDKIMSREVHNSE